MLIAFIVFVALLLIAILTTFFITRKTFKFKIDDKDVLIRNSGAYLKVYVNGKMAESYYMPNLINGETFTFKIDDKEYTLKCQCNSLGAKMSMKVFDNETLIADNGVVLKKA